MKTGFSRMISKTEKYRAMAKQQTQNSAAQTRGASTGNQNKRGSGTRRKKEGKTSHHKMFFGGVNFLAIIMLLLGLFGAFLIMADESGNAFQAVAVIILLIWAVIFLRYFTWAVYHYNVNFGLTDDDWEKIYKAKEEKALGLDVTPEALDEPQYNPYRSQTFGLPPGTVRGMIAFTLLFGGLALFIASMGMRGEMNENVFFWDHFEFFKTAFLMMVAFYFGNSSLKTLSKRWPSTHQLERIKQSGSTRGNSAAVDMDMLADDDDLIDDDDEFAAADSQVAASVKSRVTSLKEMLQNAGADPQEKVLATDYQQVQDNEFNKLLNDEELEEVIEQLRTSHDIKLEMPVLKAIMSVESNGSGFINNDPQGRAKILFEGHVFWRSLQHFDVNPDEFIQGNEDILYRRWTRAHYKGGAAEYDRLTKAMNIHKQAAIYAASWGKFQVLGENLEHNTKQRLYEFATDPNKADFKDYYYHDIQDFYDKQQESEIYHLLDFLAFIQAKTVKGTPLIDFVAGSDESKYDWAKFAYGYNGSGYKKNQYDTKLKTAYDRFKNA